MKWIQNWWDSLSLLSHWYREVPPDEDDLKVDIENTKMKQNKLNEMDLKSMGLALFSHWYGFRGNTNGHRKYKKDFKLTRLN